MILLDKFKNRKETIGRLSVSIKRQEIHGQLSTRKQDGYTQDILEDSVSDSKMKMGRELLDGC